MYITRIMERTIIEKSALFPVLLLTGPRQVGKTTMLRRLAGTERRFVSLDEPDIRRLAQTDPRLFLATYPPPVFIDEIQYVPELLPYIKHRVDEMRFASPGEANGMYWLTGSQRFHLMNAVSESLAGRIGIYELPGITQREQDGRLDAPPFHPSRYTPDAETMPLDPAALFTRIWLGNCPEVITRGPSFWSDFYTSYVQTYLERDVRALANVSDLGRFHDFIRSVAARTGQLVNYSGFARDADVSQPTAKSWLRVLEASGLVRLVRPLARHRSRELIGTPKCYLCDTGLAAYLTRWNTPQTLMAGAMAGAFFETWCVNEICSSYRNLGLEPPVFFYRDRQQHEIDLVLDENDTLTPVEIKKGARLDAGDVKTFDKLATLGAKVGMGALVSQFPCVMPLTSGAQAIPAWLI